MSAPQGRICGYRGVASYLAAGATALGALSVVGALSAAGAATFSSTIAAAGNVAMGAGARMLLDPSTSTALPPLGWNNADSNAGLSYVSADIMRFVGGGFAILTIDGVNYNITAHQATFDQALCPILYMAEVAAPTGIANFSTVFSVDVATKTQLTVIFGSGQAEAIETEN